MPVEKEDLRLAAQFKVGLSGQVASAALAMLAIEGGLVLFVLEQRTPSAWFAVWTVASSVAFVVSILMGGHGVAETYKQGGGGNWPVTDLRDFFNKQAGFCILGLVLFVPGYLTQGDEKAEDAKVSTRCRKGADSDAGAASETRPGRPKPRLAPTGSERKQQPSSSGGEHDDASTRAASSEDP